MMFDTISGSLAMVSSKAKANSAGIGTEFWEEKRPARMLGCIYESGQQIQAKGWVG